MPPPGAKKEQTYKTEAERKRLKELMKTLNISTASRQPEKVSVCIRNKPSGSGKEAQLKTHREDQCI